jgi:hypothetical protein
MTNFLITNKMNWNNITIGQFQQISALRVASKPQLDDIEQLDNISKLLSIVYDKSLDAIEELPLHEYNDKARRCMFLLTDAIPVKPVRNFKIAGQTYKINYKLQEFKNWKAQSLAMFEGDPVLNLHYIMALFSTPVKWGFKTKDGAGQYEANATAMLNAPFTAAYYTLIYYSKLYHGAFKELQPFLIDKMVKAGVSKSDATATISTATEALTEAFTFNNN